MAQLITPTVLLKIEELFNQKKWPMTNGSLNQLSLFQKFCERLKLFDTVHQELIIELSKNFLIINLNEYLERFYDSFFCLKTSLVEQTDRIFIFPLTNPFIEVLEGENKVAKGKTKSAHFLHYMLEAGDYTWISNKLIISNSINLLRKEFDNTNSILILIDDFIGSGKTAIDVCEIYLAEEINAGKIDPKNIKIVSIAAQKSEIENIEKTIGIEVFSNLVLPKGISDFFTGDDLNFNTIKMQEIEKRLKIQDDYLFGYEQSEALISFLNKTPNNTFPVYWHETLKKVAPFPRYKKYFAHG